MGKNSPGRNDMLFLEVFAGIGVILALLMYVVLYNRMMVYVEHRAYKKYETEDH